MIEHEDENEAASDRTGSTGTTDADRDLIRRLGAALRSRGGRRLPLAEASTEPAQIDWQGTPIGALSEDERSQAFEIVRRCREIDAHIQPRKPATLLDYRKKRRFLEANRLDDETVTELDQWKATLLPYPPASEYLSPR